MVDGVKSSSEVQENEDAEVAGVCGKEDILVTLRGLCN